MASLCGLCGISGKVLHIIIASSTDGARGRKGGSFGLGTHEFPR